MAPFEKLIRPCVGRITAGRMPTRGGPGVKPLPPPAVPPAVPPVPNGLLSGVLSLENGPSGSPDVSCPGEISRARSSIIAASGGTSLRGAGISPRDSAGACGAAAARWVFSKGPVPCVSTGATCRLGMARGSSPSSLSSSGGAPGVFSTRACSAEGTSGRGDGPSIDGVAGGFRRVRPRPPPLRLRGLAGPWACSPVEACGLGLPRPRPPRDPRLRGFLADPSALPPPTSSGLFRNSLKPNTHTPTLKKRSVPMIAPVFLSRRAAAREPRHAVIPGAAAAVMPSRYHATYIPKGRRETGPARCLVYQPLMPGQTGRFCWRLGVRAVRGFFVAAFGGSGKRFLKNPIS